jgi:hypothetical protein
MAEKLPTKPGQQLVPAHRRNVPSTLSRVDPITGRPRFPGELPSSTALPIDPLSAAFGYPVGTSPFQKPSDLIHQAQEPTVEDIRRVLAEHTDLLMGPSLPVTENRMRMFEAARRKHGPESTRWGENWEEAGRELGFETDAELRTLINDIYDVQGRGPFVPGMPKDDPRYEFWALEGPAFERTVQNILEKRSERESYIKGGKAAGGFVDKPLYDRAV